MLILKPNVNSYLNFSEYRFQGEIFIFLEIFDDELSSIHESFEIKYNIYEIKPLKIKNPNNFETFQSDDQEESMPPKIKTNNFRADNDENFYLLLIF